MIATGSRPRLLAGQCFHHMRVGMSGNSILLSQAIGHPPSLDVYAVSNRCRWRSSSARGRESSSRSWKSLEVQRPGDLKQRLPRRVERGGSACFGSANMSACKLLSESARPLALVALGDSNSGAPHPKSYLAVYSEAASPQSTSGVAHKLRFSVTCVSNTYPLMSLLQRIFRTAQSIIAQSG